MNSIAAAAAAVEAVASIYHLKTTEREKMVRLIKYDSLMAFVRNRSYMGLDYIFT